MDESGGWSGGRATSTLVTSCNPLLVSSAALSGSRLVQPQRTNLTRLLIRLMFSIETRRRQKKGNSSCRVRFARTQDEDGRGTPTIRRAVERRGRLAGTKEDFGADWIRLRRRKRRKKGYNERKRITPGVWTSKRRASPTCLYPRRRCVVEEDEARTREKYSSLKTQVEGRDT